MFEYSVTSLLTARPNLTLKSLSELDTHPLRHRSPESPPEVGLRLRNRIFSEASSRRSLPPRRGYEYRDVATGL